MKLTARKIERLSDALNGGFEVAFPLGVKLSFYGGPFFTGPQVPGDPFMVKCASEQKGIADVTIPCEDFGVPSVTDMQNGAKYAIEAAFAGRPVFAGCAGGIGRTGTFFAVVVKALHKNMTGLEALLFVRENYLAYAVETRRQENLIDFIDVSDIQKRVRKLWLKAVFRKWGLGFLTGLVK